MSGKRDSYGSHSVVMADLRLREEMARANEAFVAALDRYFLSRELWGR